MTLNKPIYTVLFVMFVPGLVRAVCQNGWQGNDGHCYYVSDKAATWREASYECRDMGAQLTSILSEEEDAFIANITSVNEAYYWIGLRLVWTISGMGSTSQWQWKDASRVSYSKLRKEGDGKCAYFIRFKLWRQSDCDIRSTYSWPHYRRIYFICKKPACQNGWKPNDRYCYWVSNETATWREANNDCLGMGAQLTSIQSAREDSFISNITNFSNEAHYWIGLTLKRYCMGSTMYCFNHWRWTDESKRSYFTLIEDGNGKCAYLIPFKSWRRSDCDVTRHIIGRGDFHPLHFICKKAAGTKTGENIGGDQQTQNNATDTKTGENIGGDQRMQNNATRTKTGENIGGDQQTQNNAAGTKTGENIGGDQQTQNETNQTNHLFVISGAVFGSVIVVFIVILLVICITRKRGRSDDRPEEAPSEPETVRHPVPTAPPIEILYNDIVETVEVRNKKEEDLPCQSSPDENHVYTSLVKTPKPTEINAIDNPTYAAPDDI